MSHRMQLSGISKAVMPNRAPSRISTRLWASNRGLNFLEWAGRLVPQGPVVSGVKEAWRLSWLTLMRELAPQSAEGSFVRSSYAFHKDIGSDEFPVEGGRYHVYLGNACPWCHRILLTIIVLGLEDVVSFGQVRDNPEKASRGGWIFDAGRDPVTSCSDLREVYDKCSGRDEFRGRCTAPLMIDKKQMKIVSNESSLMMRTLNKARFEGGTGVDLWPKGIEESIDNLNKTIYENVNNGVYKCGFATSQRAYNDASTALFDELERLDRRLETSRFLIGDKITEPDLRLYPTIIRFDPIYATVFRCSKRRLHSFPNLSRWLSDVYQISIPSSKLQIKDTIDIADARRSYCELFPLNPSGIVYDGPSISLDFPRSGSQDVFYLH